MTDKKEERVIIPLATKEQLESFKEIEFVEGMLWALPGPDEERTYSICRDISGKPPLKVTYTGIPPCLWCGQPVEHPSMDGPLVCGPCDMGRPRETYEERREHFAATIAQIMRDNGEELPLPLAQAEARRKAREEDRKLLSTKLTIMYSTWNPNDD